MSSQSRGYIRRALKDMKTIPWFILLVLSYVMLSVRDVMFAIAMGGVVDSALTGNVSNVINYISYLAVAAALSVPLQLFAAYTDGRFNAVGIRNLLIHALTNIDKTKPSICAADSSAQSLNHMSDDVSAIISYFSDDLPFQLCLAIYAIVPMFYLLTQNLLLGAVCYSVIPIIVLILNMVLKPLKSYVSKGLDYRAQIVQVAQEAIQQIDLIKSSCFDSIVLERVTLLQKKSYQTFCSRKRIENLSLGLNAVIGKVPTILIMSLGLILLASGEINVAALIVFVELGQKGEWLTRLVSEALSKFKITNAQLERIYNLADAPKENSEGVPLLDLKYNQLSLHNVSFSYLNEKPLFHNMNMEFNKGEITAIIGESGCGKSTLMKLLLRIYEPSHGEILCGMQNIAQVSILEWRKQLAYVPQNPFLFAGTLRDNLSLGKIINEEDIIYALEEAGLSLDNFTNGLETHIEQMGNNLSGGQLQRIAIARALLRKAKILLLDEITSALDEVNERKILKTLSHIKQEHIVLLITHRAMDRQVADNVFYLK